MCLFISCYGHSVHNNKIVHDKTDIEALLRGKR